MPARDADTVGREYPGAAASGPRCYPQYDAATTGFSRRLFGFCYDFLYPPLERIACPDIG
jgi:hypothetical protein